MKPQARTDNGSASRIVAAQAVFVVTEHGQSLMQALPKLSQQLSSRDRAFAQAMTFAVLRQLPRLNFFVSELLETPLKGKLKALHALLLVGAAQQLLLSTSSHGAVSSTVDAAKKMGFGKQAGLVNAVLRNLQRQHDTLHEKAQRIPALAHQHPRWLYERIQAAYPAQTAQVVAANNEQAPLWLRVNLAKVSRSDYLQQLQASEFSALVDSDVPSDVSSAIMLTQSIDVTQLPGFADGWVSVQDIAAQRAAFLLAPKADDRILDCCAAPGGKTVHLCETQPKLAHLVALDQDEQRLRRVHENLARLAPEPAVPVEVIAADALQLETWWDGVPFDRILLDAPCSATGVIRRHPDIKWLRRESDIQALVALQQQLLERMWSILRQGGSLLYATCSILPEENTQQVQAFLDKHPDAHLTQPAQQFLPGDQRGDGFFYAQLEKRG